MRDPFATPERLSARAQPASFYPPIGDYAIIGDSRCAALVSKEGSLDWLCLPHFSGSAVFAALLDGGRGGRYAIRPTAPFHTDRRYIGETNILETTFRTATGAVRLIDLMPIVCESERERFLQPQRELLRIVEGLQGEVEIKAVYEPRPDFGRARAVLSARGKLGWACEHRDELLMFCSDLPMRASADRASVHGRAAIKPGERRYLSLTYVRCDIGVAVPLGAHADERLRMTTE